MNKYNFYKTAFMILISQSMATKCCWSMREFCCGPNKACIVQNIQSHLPEKDVPLFQDAISRRANPINLDRATSMVVSIITRKAKDRQEISGPYENDKQALCEEASVLEEGTKKKYTDRGAIIDKIAALRTEEKKAVPAKTPVTQAEVTEAAHESESTPKTLLEEIQAKIKELNEELNPIRHTWIIRKEYVEAKKDIERRLREREKQYLHDLKSCEKVVQLVRDFEHLFGVDVKAFAESKGKGTELAQFDPERYSDDDNVLVEATQQVAELDDAI